MWQDAYKEQVEKVIKFSALTYQRSLITAAGGNVSMRCGDRVIITINDSVLRELAPDDLALLDLEGRVLECRQGRKPSKEWRLHLALYRHRQDIDSVIHAHSPFATALSVAGRSLPMITASAELKLVQVPTVEFAEPGSKDLSDKVEETVRRAPADTHALLLRRHGTLSFEKGMERCFGIAELVEDTAKIACFSMILPREM